MNILIAGGSGLIGSELAEMLRKDGHFVQVLTRKPKRESEVFWNPAEGKIDESTLKNVEVLIHLSGASVADKSWTRSRKRELLRSRIEPIEFLHGKIHEMPMLKYNLAVSGINCYGTKQMKEPYRESDAYGTGFIDQLVKNWETAAQGFSKHVPTGILRMGVVLSDKGGAVAKFTKPMRYGFGAAIGRGTQMISWIHIDDVTGVFKHAVKHQLTGTFNVLAGNCTNEELTGALAKRVGSKIRLPRVPAFLMKLFFGEMSEILLEGVEASNGKIVETGYEFKFLDLEGAVNALDIQ